MSRSIVFALAFALVASLVNAQFDFTDCITKSTSTAGSFLSGAVVTSYCQIVNNPLNAATYIPSTTTPTPSASIASAQDALSACNLSGVPAATAEPCIRAFYATGCQSVCRRFNSTGTCFMDSAVFPSNYCTDIENKCAIFTNSSCLFSPQGQTYSLLKSTSCVGGSYTFGAPATSSTDSTFPYVSADMTKVMAQLYPPAPVPTRTPNTVIPDTLATFVAPLATLLAAAMFLSVYA